jgi:molecular chaperone GrpE
VTQIGVMNSEEMQKKAVEEPEGEAREHSEETAKAEVEKNKETHLEKMTKTQLIDKVKETQETVDKNFDLYVRSQAEIENLKRRFQKDKEELFKFSNESLIKQLLPVLDNLQKAVAHSENENSLEALREGVELTLKGLIDTLEKAGLTTVKAINEPFDPNFHEAISEQEDNSVKPGTVLQELQKGYLLNDRLIRPAIVIVSKGAN